MKKYIFFLISIFLTALNFQCNNPFSSEVKSSSYEETPILLSDVGGEKQELAWSPDGNNILYIQPVEYKDIYQYSILEGVTKNIGWVALDDIGSIIVAPDYKTVVYYNSSNIYHKDLTTDKIIKLEITENVKYIRGGYYHPTKNKVYIVIVNQEYKQILIVYNLDSYTYTTFELELIDELDGFRFTENENNYLFYYYKNLKYHFVKYDLQNDNIIWSYERDNYSSNFLWIKNKILTESRDYETHTYNLTLIDSSGIETVLVDSISYIDKISLDELSDGFYFIGYLYDDNNYFLYQYTFSDSNLHQIVKAYCNDENYSYSRGRFDGNRMVLLDSKSNRTQLVLYDLYTNSYIKLTNGQYRDSAPLWLLDNEEILFTRDSQIYQFNLQNNQAQAFENIQSGARYIGGDKNLIYYLTNYGQLFCYNQNNNKRIHLNHSIGLNLKKITVYGHGLIAAITSDYNIAIYQNYNDELSHIKTIDGVYSEVHWLNLESAYGTYLLAIEDDSFYGEHIVVINIQTGQKHYIATYLWDVSCCPSFSGDKVVFNTESEMYEMTFQVNTD